jgi:hypothetical protein
MNTAWFVPVFILLCTVVDAGAQQSRMLATCRPAGERTGPVGCWIIVQEPLAEMPAAPVFWHLSTYPSRAAAEAEKAPSVTVMEALDKVWAFTIAPADAPLGGTRVAQIGPLGVKAGTRYTAQYMEAIFPPGAQTRPHTHAGPEAWYHEAGGVCLETPDGRGFGRAGDGFIESHRPATTLDTTWAPKGLCNE